MLVDTHIHNGFSGCRPDYTPIDAMWNAAQAAGLSKIVITNHCDPKNHRCTHIQQTREEISALGLDDVVVQGVELNINADPQADDRSDLFLKPELWEYLDFVNMGEHIFFGMTKGFLTNAVQAGDVEAFEEYCQEKTRLILDAFTRYPSQAGGHPPQHATWVHPWLWEVQNGFLFPEQMYPATKPILAVMADRGISFEVNGYLFRVYDYPKPPLLQKGTFDEHYAGVLRFYSDFLARVQADFPDMTFTVGSDAHKVHEIGDLWVPLQVLKIAGIPRTKLISP